MTNLDFPFWLLLYQRAIALATIVVAWGTIGHIRSSRYPLVLSLSGQLGESHQCYYEFSVLSDN